MTFSFNVTLNTAGLDRLLNSLSGASDVIGRKVALDWVADMKSHMSRSSPSAPGDPPGVDTGYLVNHLEVRQNGGHWGIWGPRYGVYLEYGAPTRRVRARPWITPSAMRIKGQLPAAVKAALGFR